MIGGVPRLAHHISGRAVALDAIRRGLRHRKAACETHGQAKRGEELKVHAWAALSESRRGITDAANGHANAASFGVHRCSNGKTSGLSISLAHNQAICVRYRRQSFGLHLQ